MTLSVPQIRLFAFLLRYYLQVQDERLGIIDKEMADIFRSLGESATNEWRNGKITKEERDKDWDEVDHEISKWQRRLDDFQYEKFFLKKFEEELRGQLREENYANAA